MNNNLSWFLLHSAQILYDMVDEVFIGILSPIKLILFKVITHVHVNQTKSSQARLHVIYIFSYIIFKK